MTKEVPLSSLWMMLNPHPAHKKPPVTRRRKEVGAIKTVIKVISLILCAIYLLCALKAKEEKDAADTTFYMDFAVLMYLTAIT